jgi:hypothetical protein
VRTCVQLVGSAFASGRHDNTTREGNLTTASGWPQSTNAVLTKFGGLQLAVRRAVRAGRFGHRTVKAENAEPRWHCSIVINVQWGHPYLPCPELCRGWSPNERAMAIVIMRGCSVPFTFS